MRPERPRRALAPLALADDDQTAWLITFSDLVLQLFAFVLVMSALGHARPTTTVAAPPPPPVHHHRHAARHLRPRPAAAPVAPPAPVPAPVPPVALATAGRDLAQFVARAGQSDAVSVAASEGEVVLTLGEAVSFPSGSDDLQPGARPVLAEVSRLASAMPDVSIHVVGHTDDVPIHTAAFPSNLELSLARAARVARELVAGDPSLRARTFAEGFGAERPVAPNTDAEGRARNRRVEIRLVRRDRP
ncbi:MAG TPA: flagellar motor protein MotB [Candidatus Binatia bacterium]|nr:flagellar motor protein MotB [Candidatus Binatia bacterium]